MIHSKSFGEKYIVYFLVSQVMSLKQCQHNDHVLAIIKNLLCFIFQSQDLDFLCTCYIHELVLFLFYTLYLFGHQSNVCACCPLLFICYTDSNPWKVELCILNGDFGNTNHINIFSGQWSLLGHCFYLFRKLEGLIYISVVIIDHIISLNLFSY